MFEAVQHLVFLDPLWHPVGGRLYCPVCISQSKPPAPPGWNTRTDVVKHLKVTHRWESPSADDALNATELTGALIEWRKQQDEIADGFGTSLKLVRGLEDFLSECDAA